MPPELAVPADTEPTLDALAAANARLTEAEAAALVRAATPLLRPLLARRRAARGIAELLGELVHALATDVAAPQERVGFGGPFNGQRRRQELFNRLNALLGFGCFLETGAFRGTTTEMLAELDRPVFSCELNRPAWIRAAARLAACPNVRLTHQDSRGFLRDVLARPDLPRPPFCYLDAHWNEDLPLPEEIDLIADRLDAFVIFADDFQHPDPGYSFDRYPSGAELTLDYLLPRLTTQAPLTFLVPSAPAASETGGRRGTLVVVPTPLHRTLLHAETLLTRVAER